jgi:polysaccharide chain length determinant protein (PEP-CTERM system associated)
MSDENKKIKPELILEIVLKRHWFVIVPFCLSMIIGTILVVKLPRLYQSTTVILVQAQKVPDTIVKDIVTSDLSTRISTLSQQILSRSNLEKIINDFDLYSGPKNKNMFLEEKVKDLASRINVKVLGGGKEADSFTISYKGTDPEKVMRVTSSLASSFIDENLKTRESQAEGTNSFLEDELETMRKRLADTEQKLKEYREGNMGGLPEQLDSNLKILGNLNDRLTAIQANISSVRDRLSSLSSSGMNSSNRSEQNSGSSRGDSSAQNLKNLEEQLEIIKNKYTEDHPDVIRLKKMISDLKKQKKDDKSIQNDGGGQYSQAYLSDRRSFISEISRLENEKQSILNQIASYKKRVEETPKREEELQSLQRDYTNISQTYNSLLNRQLEAQIAVNMEKKQKGEQFRILDPARLPQTPVSPDMRKMFMFVLVAGLGVGGALIFALEYFDSSFKSAEDVETFLEIPVIVTIPTILGENELQKNRKRLYYSLSGVAVSLVLLASFMGSIIVMR